MKKWAFVDRRGDDGELVGSFEQVEMPEPTSQDAYQRGRLWYARRLALRLSLMAVANETGLSILRVSELEHGYSPEATAEEVAAMGRALWGKR